MAELTSCNTDTHQKNVNSSGNEDMLDVNEDLEKMTEHVENQSVQLKWMAYDLVVLRTNPELLDAMQRLEQAYLSCRAAVFGACREDGRDSEPRQCQAD